MNNSEMFAPLWTKAQPAVTGFVCSSIKNFDEAKDILQNVALIAFRKFDQYDPQRSFTGWVIGIARNEIFLSRRTHARSILTYHAEIYDSLAEVHDELSAEFEVRQFALRECLSGMGDHARNLLDMRYTDALKPSQIAARIHKNAGAVRTMLTRIRDALHRCVEKRMSTTGASA